MGDVVRFRRRAPQLDANPSVEAARAFLTKLRGRAYRYAYRVFAWAKGKGPKPRGSSGSPELDQAITRAVGAAAPAGAVAVFAGLQERPGGKPALELYHLTRDIPGHPKGSTVARETIEAAGFSVPKRRAASRGVSRRNLPSWLDTPGAGVSDPEGSNTAKCHKCGDLMTEAETLAGPVCRRCALDILAADLERRRNPMSAAARKAYPTIAKLQDDAARVYREALTRFKGDKAKAQDAVNAYLGTELFSGKPDALKIPRRNKPKSNPPRSGVRDLPSNATLIYPKGRFGPGTTWFGTHRSGGRYYHKFRSDTIKAMYGLPHGGIAFIPKRGRLWGYR